MWSTSRAEPAPGLLEQLDALDLDEGDTLVGAAITNGESDILLVASNGKAALEGLRPGTWRITMRQGMGGMMGGRGGAGGNQNAGGNNDPVQIVTVIAGQTIDVTL